MAAQRILLFACVVVISCLAATSMGLDDNLVETEHDLEKRSLARDGEYYAEDEYLEDVVARYRPTPTDLLMKFNYRHRRDDAGARVNNDHRQKRNTVDGEKSGRRVGSPPGDFLALVDGMEVDAEIDMANVCQAIDDHKAIIVTCESDSPYRTMNGACNNLEAPTRGQTLQPHVRWLEPKYNDVGKFLPRDIHVSARNISAIVIELDDRSADKAQADRTMAIMHYGQFIDHDITETPSQPGGCDCKNMNSSCYPIMISESDPVFKTEECFKTARSRAYCGDTTKWDQFNAITSFTDASNVYGSTEDEVAKLRSHAPGAENAGRLHMFEISGRQPQLPHQVAGDCFGEDVGKGVVCGEAGDFRAAEQPGLTSLHTVFARLHNVVAGKLIELNPEWGQESDSDRVFNEARKIVGGIMQSIDFNQYLPALLGEEEFKNRVGEYTGFNKKVDPTIANIFASSAFRQGHSAVDAVLERYDATGNKLDDVPLDKAFFNPGAVYDFENGGIDSILRGMARQPARKIDRFMVKPLHQRLFVDPEKADDTTGLDIVSLNIMRGRDHGLEPYAQWRKYCKLPHVVKWDDVSKLVSEDTLAKLKEAYGEDDKAVGSIDSFIGFVSEEPQAGSTLGPTLSCIIGQQFKNLRDGDRFYYDNPEGVQAFTEAQRGVIGSATLAQVFCETLDNPTLFQPDIFRPANDETNPRSDCGSDAIPALDLSAWRDESGDETGSGSSS